MTPKELPVVSLEGEAYFFDFKLSQLRKVKRPHEFLDLSPSERKELLDSLSYLEVVKARRGGSTGTKTRFER